MVRGMDGDKYPVQLSWLPTDGLSLYSGFVLLPNGESAIVNIRKLRDYCLNPDSPRGSRKARVFKAALGMTAADTRELRERLRDVAATEQAQMGELDRFGQRYTIDFEMQKGHKRAFVRSGWIILRNEMMPRLTTCYVRKRGK